MIAAVILALAPDALSRDLRRHLDGTTHPTPTHPAPTAATASGPSGPSTPTRSPTPTPSPTAASPRSAAAAAQTPAGGPATTDSTATDQLDALVAQDSPSSTSVAAYNVTTGARVESGATSGMITASVIKVELLESLLYQREQTHTLLSDDEVATATSMIENSDNDSAEDIFEDVGDRPAVVSLEPALGLSTTSTVPGDGDYWGLTTTSAAQQLVLLDNLVSSSSPLDAASRSFALSLMENVEADQRWGVPVTATSGDPAVKNGWLAVDADNDLWAINSIGVVTAHGDTVLVAVMTQHDDTMDDGVARVQTLAQAAVDAVTP